MTENETFSDRWIEQIDKINDDLTEEVKTKIKIMVEPFNDSLPFEQVKS